MVESRATRRVKIVEVGPRDGLQNERVPIPTAIKVRFIESLATAGFPVVETTSFVNPSAVPQMADADSVMRTIVRQPGVQYLALVPNERGLDRALAAGVDAIALFTAATDAFARANVGTSIAGTFARFRGVVERARDAGCWVRGYVSVAFGCPYAGPVSPGAAVAVAADLFALGCCEVSIADTTGSADPSAVTAVLSAADVLPLDRLALHFHDTADLAIANVEAALAGGVRIFDSSAGGLGGCPFAPGAPGNLATERLLAALAAWGWETGIDLQAVERAVAELAESGTIGTGAVPSDLAPDRVCER
jgi:isopropylmalate/homocitrate/citramalate synthase